MARLVPLLPLRLRDVLVCACVGHRVTDVDAVVRYTARDGAVDAIAAGKVCGRCTAPVPVLDARDLADLTGGG